MNDVTTFATDLGNVAEQIGGGAQAASEPAQAVDAPASSDVDSGQPAAQPPAAGNTGLPGKDDTPPWMKREITMERNKRRAIEAELAAEREKNLNLARALGEGREKRQEQPSTDRPKRPRRDDFMHPEDFDRALDDHEEDLANWVSSRAEARVEAKTSQRSHEQAVAVRQSEMQNAWQAQLEAAKTKIPDVLDVLADPDFNEAIALLPKNNAEALADAITSDENGVLVMHHLASHPEEAERIFNMGSAAAQVREIGKLSVKVGAPAPVSKAPAPIKPLGAQAPAGRKDPADESFEEYSARRRSEMKGRNEKAW